MTFLAERNEGYVKDRRGGAALAELRNTLLSIGGEEVCLQFEEDIAKLKSRGKRWLGRVKMCQGEPSRCHANSAFLWEANQDSVWIVTGWALSDDGIWRQHTWGWQRDNVNPEKGRIIETTERRIAYFGFALTTPESNQFWEDNCIC